MRTLMVAVAVVLFSASLDARIWTDSTGKYRIEAEFVQLEGETVHLRRPDGQSIAIPLERLSPADQAYARQQAAPAAEDAAAEPPPSPSEPAVAGDGGDLDDLVGARIHIQLNSGEVLKDVEVLAIRQGKYPGSLTSVTIRGSAEGQKSTLGAGGIQQLKRTDGACHLVYIPNAKALMPPGSEVAAPAENVIPKEQGSVPPLSTATPDQVGEEDPKQTAEARRLAFHEETGVWLWPELSEEEQLAAVKEQKEYLVKVTEHFMPTKMVLFERERLLFCTDLPSEEALVYIRYLESMYDTLRNLFGMTERGEIWRGKLVVVAFLHEASYKEFEQIFFPLVPPSENLQANTYFMTDGNAIISGHREADSQFGGTLVHEMCHGFQHRYKSSQQLPGWILEGGATWIGGKIVPEFRARQAARLVNLRRELMEASWELDGRFFTARKMTQLSQYGLACDLTDFLLRRGGDRYREFFGQIKLGVSWEESLRKAYGLSVEELVQLYGRENGMPALHLAPGWRDLSRMRVFVSFDVEHDGDLKELLSRQVEEFDLNCVINGCSTTYRDSDDWKKETREMIKDAQLALFICGKHTTEAQGVSAELQMAQNEGIPRVFLSGREDESRTPNNVQRPYNAYRWSRLNLQGVLDPSFLEILKTNPEPTREME